MLEDLKKLGQMASELGPLKELVQFETLAEIKYKNETYPIFSFSIGTTDPTAPCLFITGGIHGLERVGAQLAWSLLKTTLDRLLWDTSLQALYQHTRLVIIPLVNPVGFFHFKRSNGNNVDLMRNAPINSTERTLFLVSGHNLSHKLPWYRGDQNHLEIETQALLDKFLQVNRQSRCVIALDFHSGFGMRDRLWFPFSYTATPFDKLAELMALTHLFEETHPYHVYKIEPQSKSYLINGDFWDYCYLELNKINPTTVFIPLTLEMGSWTWVRKNPLQIFSKHGIFNPVKSHRLKRTYRRHHLLYDFLMKAIHSHSIWSELSFQLKNNYLNSALTRWYEK